MVRVPIMTPVSKLLNICFFPIVTSFILSPLSLIHHIVNKNIMTAIHHQATAVALSPALVETYSRLLVYTEIETLGIKGFICKSLLTPTLFLISF